MKVNKYLLVFMSLFFLLTALTGMVMYKFFPLLIHHTIYFCQRMTHALSLQIPGNMGMLFFTIIFTVLLFTAIKFVATLLKIYRFRRYLLTNTSKYAPYTTLLKNLGLTGKVATIQSEKPFAFCFGVRTPKIYVSSVLVSLLTKDEFETMLLHEKHHLESRDALTLLVAHMVESLFPFFPLLSDLIMAYRTEREMLADQAAILGGVNKNLISIFNKLLLYGPDRNYAMIPAISDPHTLEARIRSLMHGSLFNPIISRKKTLLSLFSLAIIFFFVIIPVGATELHIDGHDVMVFCVQTHYFQTSPSYSSLR